VLGLWPQSLRHYFSVVFIASVLAQNFSARAEGRVAESLAKFSAAALTAVESDAVKAFSDSSTVAPSRESFFAYLCPDGFDIMSGRF
jgi:hypothetical protein